jgi:hypothetical protein
MLHVHTVALILKSTLKNPPRRIVSLRSTPSNSIAMQQRLGIKCVVGQSYQKGQDNQWCYSRTKEVGLSSW